MSWVAFFTTHPFPYLFCMMMKCLLDGPNVCFFQENYKLSIGEWKWDYIKVLNHLFRMVMTIHPLRVPMNNGWTICSKQTSRIHFAQFQWFQNGPNYKKKRFFKTFSSDFITKRSKIDATISFRIALEKNSNTSFRIVPKTNAKLSFCNISKGSTSFRIIL